MPQDFAAALFDLDGTLVDTEALCNVTGVAACAEFGVMIPLAFFESLAGIHDAERVRRIVAETGRPLDPVAFYAAWDRLTNERMASGIPLKPGVHAVLSGLQARGVPLALVTSSRRGPAHDKLRAAGIAGYFDRVVTVEDVAHPKPAADPYLVAAAALNVDPAACIVFEDSEPGAASGRAAGCTVVQIPDGHTTPGGHAHHIAGSLTDGARMAGLRL